MACATLINRPVSYGVKTRTRMLPVSWPYCNHIDEKAHNMSNFFEDFRWKISRTRLPVHTAVWCLYNQPVLPGRAEWASYGSIKSLVLHPCHTAAQHGRTTRPVLYNCVYWSTLPSDASTRVYCTQPKQTRCSAIAKGPREAPCQLKYCQLLNKFTKKSHLKRCITLKVTQGHQNCRYSYSCPYIITDLLNNVSMLHHLWDITTFTVYVTACDLVSFSFNKSAEIIGHVCSLVHE